MADQTLEELEQEALADLETQGAEEETTKEVATDDEVGEPAPEDEELDKEPEAEEEAGSEEPGKDEDNLPEPKKDEEDVDNELGFKLKKPVKIKSRGMEIDINSEKELIELAHKGFDYFKKTQELAKWRKDIGVIEDAGLGIEELQLLADVKNGDKEAIAALMNTYGYDPLEVEPEAGVGYKPQTPNLPDFEIQDIVETIKSEPEHAQHFQQIASAVPDDFLNEVGSDPVKLAHFNDHIKRGLADKIVPEAMKAQALYGGKFMDHYTRIGQQLAAQDMQTPTPSPTPASEPKVAPQQKPLSDRERELRRKATTPKRGSKKVSFKADAESIWDMSDEEFAKLSASDLK